MTHNELKAKLIAEFRQYWRDTQDEQIPLGYIDFLSRTYDEIARSASEAGKVERKKDSLCRFGCDGRCCSLKMATNDGYNAATALNKEREELAQKCERAILPENAWSLGIVPHSFQATRGIMADLIRSRITKDSLQSDA